MEQHYVIQLKQKSKGFVKALRKWYHRGGRDYKPVMTKQFALGLSFDSPASAQAFINAELQYCENDIHEHAKHLRKFRHFARLDVNTVTEDHVEEYCQLVGNRWLKRNIMQGRTGFYNPQGTAVVEAWQDRFIREVGNKIASNKSHHKFLKEKIDFLKTQLYINPADVELKFKDNEKWKKDWKVNKSKADSYCNNCGCSIPDAYYLTMRKTWKQEIKICQFCAEKIAEEAQLYADRADPEVRELWEQSYFLHKMD